MKGRWALWFALGCLGCSTALQDAQKFYFDGQYRAASERYTEYLESNPRDAQAQFELGDALYLKYTDDFQKNRADSNDLTRALGHFTTAIQLNTNYAAAYSQRGVVALTLGNKEGAKRDYDRAIELDPKFDRSYFNRGYWYEQAGEWDAALRDYRTYVEMTENVRWREDALRRIETLELRKKVSK